MFAHSSNVCSPLSHVVQTSAFHFLTQFRLHSTSSHSSVCISLPHAVPSAFHFLTQFRLHSTSSRSSVCIPLPYAVPSTFHFLTQYRLHSTSSRNLCFLILARSSNVYISLPHVVQTSAFHFLTYFNRLHSTSSRSSNVCIPLPHALQTSAFHFLT